MSGSSEKSLEAIGAVMDGLPLPKPGPPRKSCVGPFSEPQERADPAYLPQSLGRRFADGLDRPAALGDAPGHLLEKIVHGQRFPLAVPASLRAFFEEASAVRAPPAAESHAFGVQQRQDTALAECFERVVEAGRGAGLLGRRRLESRDLVAVALIADTALELHGRGEDVVLPGLDRNGP